MVFRNRSPAHSAKNNGGLKMKGLKNVIFKKMRSYNWDWIILGAQLIGTGIAIWYNAQHDVFLLKAFVMFSEPYWIYLPFIIGIVAIYIGITDNKNKYLLSGALYSLTFYWILLTTLLYLNDTFNNHISIIAVITTFIIPKLWLMAFREDVN